MGGGAAWRGKRNRCSSEERVQHGHVPLVPGLVTHPESLSQTLLKEGPPPPAPKHLHVQQLDFSKSGSGGLSSKLTPGCPRVSELPANGACVRFFPLLSASATLMPSTLLSAGALTQGEKIAAWPSNPDRTFPLFLLRGFSNISQNIQLVQRVKKEIVGKWGRRNVLRHSKRPIWVMILGKNVQTAFVEQ